MQPVNHSYSLHYFHHLFWSTVYYRGTFSLYFYIQSTNHNPNHPIYTQKSKKFSGDFYFNFLNEEV